MLNSKTFRLILSLVIAILLWAFVIGTKSTTTTAEISGIPITMTHTVELGERGLAVSSTNIDSIDVEVTGTRSLLADLTTDDITATVDLAAATKGDNELSIMVRVPNGSIRVTDKSAAKVSVMVEDLIQKPVDVSITYTGTFAEGQAGDTMSIATPQITVSGAESLVNMVSSIRGTVDASRLSDDPTEITCQLKPVNSEGSPVSGVILSQESVSVKSVLSQTKRVPITVEVIDNSSDDMVRKTTIPKEVSIVGRADKLASVSVIETEPVDVTNIAESKEIDLQFKLPEGISLSDRNDSADLALGLTVSQVNTKTFTYEISDVKLTGVSNTMVYTALQGTQIVVTVMDDVEVLSRINKNSISVSCDVSNLVAGVYTINLHLDCNTEIYSMDANPRALDITVTAADKAATRVQTSLIAAAATNTTSGVTGNSNADSDSTNG